MINNRDTGTLDFQEMILDILKGILTRAEDPELLSKHFTKQLRELTGVKLAVVMQANNTLGGNGHSVTGSDPERNQSTALSENLVSLVEQAHDMNVSRFYETRKETGEVAKLLKDMGIETAIISPLNVGASRIGCLLLMDLPDSHISRQILDMLDLLSPIVAMVFQNAFMYQNQESIIEQRTLELTNSEAKYRLLIENAIDGIYIINEERRFEYTNPAFRKILGFNEKEINDPNFSIYDIIHPEDRKLLTKREKERKKGKELPSKYAFKALSKDGSIKHLEVNTVVLPGEKIKVFGVMRDNTEAELIEKELNREKELSNMLIEGSPDIIYFKDLKNRFIRINEKFLKKHGFNNPKEIIGKTDFDLFTDEHANNAYKDEQEIIETGLSVIDKEEKETWPDGSITWASTTKLPLHDSEGKIIGTCGISRDITNRKITAEKLLKAYDINAQRLKELSDFNELQHKSQEAALNLMEDLSLEIGERKRTENALRISEKRYSEIAKNIPGSVCQFFMKKDGSIFLTYLSEGTEEMYECTPREMIEMKDGIYYRIHTDDNEHYRKSIKNSSERHNDLEVEYRILMDNGSVKWLRIIASPHKLPNGDVIWNGVIFDITVFKQSVADLERIFNMSGYMICVADFEGNFRKVNPAFYDILGYEESELLNQSIYKFIHGDDRDESEARFKGKLKKGERVIGFENRFRCKNGDYKWIEWTIQPVVDERIVFAIASDISDRKKVQLSLNESEEKFKILFENAPDAYYLTDMKGTFIDGNKAAEKLTGYKRTELIGQSFLSERLLDKKQLSKAIKLLARSALGNPTGPNEFTLIRKGRDKVVAEILTHPVRISDSNLILGIARDISIRKLTEDQLKISEKKLRKLAQHLQTVREAERTNIAREVHDELGQLTTALKMDIIWLKNKFSKDNPELLDKLMAMSELTDMTNESIQRISSELRPGIIDDLGLIPAIEWHVKDFQLRTGIHCDLEMKIGDSIIDPDRTTAIYRILQESLTNVLRHSSASAVKILFQKSKKHLFLKISDNGKGIPADHIDNQKSYGLIGIQERAAMFGGEVVFASNNGKGTAVKVTIPV